ncbi:MAG: serine/threonine protein kinase [Gemmataceae bacterium]|nr:serine/threonine protein kinase [Gemmataceae bacterium]
MSQPGSFSSSFRARATLWKGEDLPPPADPKPTVGSFGHYTLLAELGQGSTGVVYRARDTRLNRMVALKAMRPDILASTGELVGIFWREARVAAQLNHPNIVHVYEVGEQDGKPFIAMEYVEGGNLSRKISAAPLSAHEAARLVVVLAVAVHHAHVHGVVHRDLKPANVLLTADGTPKVTDFGLARAADHQTDLASAGTLLGTPSYMAPEQADGRAGAVTPAADVWALGVLLYELTTGQQPFQGSTLAALLHAVQHAEPVPPRSIRADFDPRLESIILQCLAKSPAQRHASAKALAEALESWIVRAVEPGRRWTGRSIASRASLVATLGLLLTGAFGVTTTDQAPSIHTHTTQRQLLEEAIVARRDIQMVGEQWQPGWHRWRAGESRQFELRPLTIAAVRPCLLDLLPRAPAGPYRLEAEVTPARSQLGEAGLYFFCSDQATSEGNEHHFAALTLARSRYLDRLALSLCRHRAKSAERASVFHTSQIFIHPLSSLPLGRQSYRVAVEWTGKRLRVFLEDHLIDERDAADMAAQYAKLLTSTYYPSPTPPAIMPHGAAGLLVHGGEGAFRQVALKPLE